MGNIMRNNIDFSIRPFYVYGWKITTKSLEKFIKKCPRLTTKSLKVSVFREIKEWIYSSGLRNCHLIFTDRQPEKSTKHPLYRSGNYFYICIKSGTGNLTRSTLHNLLNNEYKLPQFFTQYVTNKDPQLFFNYDFSHYNSNSTDLDKKQVIFDPDINPFTDDGDDDPFGEDFPDTAPRIVSKISPKPETTDYSPLSHEI